MIIRKISNYGDKKLKKLIKITLIASALSMPLIAHADWSIKALDARIFLGANNQEQVLDINNLGQVVGSYFIGDPQIFHAYMTGENGVGFKDLGTLGGDRSVAYGINDLGQVVGQAQLANKGPTHAFITGPDGLGMRDLNVPFPSEFSRASSINNSGQVAGDTSARAFITGPDGVGVTVKNIGQTIPVDINESGRLVGQINGTAFITGPDGKVITPVQPLPGGLASLASAINDSGQVVGRSGASYGIQAYVTGENGVGITNLGTFGGSFSEATDINNAGEVVGIASLETPEAHSFLYSHGGMTDLSLLDVVIGNNWSNIQVTAINDNGQILGYGTLIDPISGLANTRGFILSYTSDTVFNPQPIFIPAAPIPEPETYAMLLAGLGLIGFIARRRKQNS
ncbi:PEP-CTERM sorting domain-containing protein [Nitrosomonas sp.]|uniref:PEP-CTERM sorting domain-containing protein n=1 Tax=Nitrosomonas sp. TaxID=42353 RepID=UPI0026100026|nr:PEP-CTERM sorting domain-containing protein [Nitrosomonas sp.]